jgi:hypothetical protein
MKNARSIQVGAITVFAATPDKTLPAERGNSRIVIEGNKIEESGGIGMLIACAQSVTVRSNRIGATRIPGAMTGGAKFGVDPEAAVFVAESSGVRFDGNQLGGKGIVLGTNAVGIVR